MTEGNFCAFFRSISYLEYSTATFFWHHANSLLCGPEALQFSIDLHTHSLPRLQAQETELLLSSTWWSAKCFIENDLQLWRKIISDWFARIKDAHDKGEYITLTTHYKLLGRTVYRQALPETQKARVDEGIANGNIKLVGEEENPIRTVLAIVYLISMEPPTAQATMLLTSYQAMRSCHITSWESLTFFIRVSRSGF